MRITGLTVTVSRPHLHRSCIVCRFAFRPPAGRRDNEGRSRPGEGGGRAVICSSLHLGENRDDREELVSLPYLGSPATSWSTESFWTAAPSRLKSSEALGTFHSFTDMTAQALINCKAQYDYFLAIDGQMPTETLDHHPPSVQV